MLNGIDHNSALEYAEAFNLGIADNADLDGMLTRWHKNFGENGEITDSPNACQLAWLRGLEAAGMWRNVGPRFNPGTVTLNELFATSTIITD
mgnify:CR=1 FL=1